MIDRLQLASLPPAKRAEVIYASARADLTGRLWRAALGDGDEANRPAGDGWGGCTAAHGPDLLSLLGPTGAPDAAAIPPGFSAEPAAPASPSKPLAPRGLGPNAHLAPALERAAARTGLPPAALATIVDAEAAKGRDGAWNAYSRNPRSSAAGLGQFLSSTWIGEAQRPGTWLHARATAEGWLTGGRVAPGAQGALLNLRYSAEASIEATADYARANLDALRKRGVAIGEGATDIARAAYLGHHLGLGDALQFLGRGIDRGRARVLLAAQVGSAAAATRIAAAGDAQGAHRAWLQSYLDKRIRPDRFGI